jgi:tetratricopeptide (TPR) repeat protein
MYDKAVEEAEKAVALDSNDATAHAALANVMNLVDRPGEGLTYIQNAMRLDPYYPPKYLTILGAAQFGMENYEEALSTFDRAVKRNPKSERSLIYMASCYGHLGRMREAEDTIEATNELRATLTGLGALSLERVTSTSFSAFTGEIDFPSFGTNSAQARLRVGLSKIPALTWQYLVTYHIRLGAGETWAEIKGATKIDLATAKSFHDRGVIFIVLDNEAEAVWKNGRVPGAVNLPLFENKPGGQRFRETTLSEVLEKTDEVVIYACPTENYCIPTFPIAKAVNWGYQNVYYFDGGIAAWKDAGYPIEMDD